MSASMTDRSNRWVKHYLRRPDAPVRLFGFHYAGGSASLFRPWASGLPSFAETVGVQLPGRENRLGEPPFERMAPLVDRLVDVLVPHFDRPFAFFGYSMGARVAFALGHALRERGLPSPSLLFVAGSPGPSLESEVEGWDESDERLIDYLRDLGGTPADVLDRPDLLSVLLPTVRADLTVVATTPYRSRRPLEVPIHALAGMDDDYASPAHMQAWSVETAAGFELSAVPGGHFFVHSAPEQVLDLVAGRLAPLGTGSPAAPSIGVPA